MRLLRRSRSRAVVLVYHRVAETLDDPYGLAVRPDTFSRHLELLAREHPIVPLVQLVETLPGARFPHGAIAVSFDDGYADNLSEALPIAEALPITVFVTVEPILHGGRFWWDAIASLEPRLRAELHAELKGLPGPERSHRIATLNGRDDADRGRPLTVDELRELASRPGVEIGAHTLSHPSLALLSADEQESEMLEARNRLESLLGGPVTLLAYPFGKPNDVSGETERLARGAGYRAAFTSVPGCLVPSSPTFALPRLTVHECPPQKLARRVRECLGESS